MARYLLGKNVGVSYGDDLFCNGLFEIWSSRMKRKRFIRLTLMSVLTLLVACSPSKDSELDLEKVTKSRPSEDQSLFDYAGVLEEAEEYTNRYLNTIKGRYGIEAIIVSLPSLGESHFIEELAVKILNTWKIGKACEGKGFLLLLTDKEKEVKMEVSYEIEDVFTDAFCGYVADLQLKPYFLEGQVGIGLLAVMEEIEQRAQTKHQGDYNPADIAKLDAELLSGGAGVWRDLSTLERETVEEAARKYPPGNTPEEAWQTLIESWRDKVRDPNKGVYTETTKLAYRDHQNLPDARYEKDYHTYHGKPFQVIQDESYAVIFFGNKKGWDNSPFLFCKTPEGWKFDIVHQRKYIRMGPSPHWAVERSNHPYIDLLSRCPYYMGQDIPWEAEDIYRVSNDEQIAKRIKELEAAYQEKPDDFEIVMALGRLYTITSMGKRRLSLLKRAKQLNPDSPTPSKYLAIAHVDAMYQYESAIEELTEYIRKKPGDVFGHNLLGYLYFCIGKYREATDAFERACQLNPDNIYGYCKLSRSYGALYLQASPSDSERALYKEQAIKMLNEATRIASIDPRRIGWLEEWLKKEHIL